MRVSVIIATFNRAALLDECLAHLGRQQFGPGDEVIVVDNGSTDSTPAVIARHARALPVPLQRLEEHRPGKSVAIARALAVASGEVFAFTDDDVNVDARWLEELRHAMRASDVALVGGPMLARWERQPPRWLAAGDHSGRLAAPLALVDYGPEPIELGPRTAMGGNMAIRRDVINHVGGFAPNLGSVRGTLRTGEDQELCRRVQAAGYRAMYQPSAIVYHWVPAHRVSVRYFLRWYFWSGIANAVQDGSTPSQGAGVFGIPRYLIKRFAIGVATAPALALCGRTTQAVNRAVDAAYCVGYAAQCWGLIQGARGPAPSTTVPVV